MCLCICVWKGGDNIYTTKLKISTKLAKFEMKQTNRVHSDSIRSWWLSCGIVISAKSSGQFVFLHWAIPAPCQYKNFQKCRKMSQHLANRIPRTLHRPTKLLRSAGNANRVGRRSCSTFIWTSWDCMELLCYSQTHILRPSFSRCSYHWLASLEWQREPTVCGRIVHIRQVRCWERFWCCAKRWLDR